MYSRQSPSPRYLELLSLNRQLHMEGDAAQSLAADDAFPGKSLFAQLPRIKDLVRSTRASTLLDYGCGKGRQYQVQSFAIDGAIINESVQDYLDVDYIYRYDAAFPQYTQLPEGRFDGVICTDVLEHCPEQDLPWIIEELFGYASKFVFANVPGFSAMKKLPNGENAHCTQRESQWWNTVFGTAARKHPGIYWEVLHVSRLGPQERQEHHVVRLGTNPSIPAGS